jgi:hypothetical protein
MATLANRKTVRAALVAMFESTGEWVNVYGHQPATYKRKTPVMTILSDGTGSESNTRDLNPTDFIFKVRNYVLMDDKTGVWTTPEAEDKLDDLEQIYRQTVIDNQGNKGVTTVDLLQLDPSPSIAGVSVLRDGVPYRTEEFTLHAKLVCGNV